MKKWIIVLLLTTLSATMAQDLRFSDKALKRSEISIVNTMDSELNTLVESTIFNLLIFKEKYPDWDFNRIISHLNELAFEGKSVSVRYKAYLASVYLNNYEDFRDISFTEKENPNKYFKMIADRVEDQIMASN